MSPTPQSKLRLLIASEADRQVIYAIRHAVYADELRQHPINDLYQLTDSLDAVNHYVVAKQDDKLVGFVSVTSPTAKTYSVDKYFDRSVIPYPFDEDLYEIRLLTVIKTNRASHVALALMFASFRWIQSHGGQHIVAICRTDLAAMYQKAGLQLLGQTAKSGQMTYELAIAGVDQLQQQVRNNYGQYEALRQKLNWQLPFSYFAPSACYHGGQFFNAIGEELQTLYKAKQIINADVLDAWFPPSPAVLNILQENLAWLLQTSPPTHANGLRKVIAQVRGVSEQCILPGAGSSDLIFLAMGSLLSPASKVLLLDPCYGEYPHVLEQVIGCQISRFALCRANEFNVDTEALLTEIKRGYDLVVLVNPNSPTGVHIPRKTLETMLSQVPITTLVWVDETYIDFVNAAESLEQFAVTTENVIICKSMSKAYALSGIRVAYLCSSPHWLETLKSLSPPWAVSLPAQAAAIAALNDPDYYREKYAQTHSLRATLKQSLLNLGVEGVINGVANFLLFYLPDHVVTSEFLAACRHENLFLRDVSNMGKSLGPNAVRIAVKDAETNNRMVAILEKVLSRVEQPIV